MNIISSLHIKPELNCRIKKEANLRAVSGVMGLFSATIRSISSCVEHLTFLQEHILLNIPPIKFPQDVLRYNFSSRLL